MKKKFSINWKKSRQPRKQRKYVYNAPLHVRQKFMHARLSKELQKKYGKKSFGLKKGDKVKVVRGQFKKHENKIERIDLKKCRVIITGIEVTKKDGNKTRYPIHPSNLILTELNMDDKMRQKILDRKRGKNA
jgi:large subunit ribosomal protein L24